MAITDKITKTFNSTNPRVAKVTAGRTALATSLTCDNLSGWPTTPDAVHFSTYKIDTNNALIAGTQIDWKGIVSGNTIGSLVRQAGATDTGSEIGDIVEMNPTASWANDLANGLLTSLDADGTLKAGAVDSAAVLASDVVTTAKILDDAVSAPKLSGLDRSNLTVDSNPYKFLVYKNAGQVMGGSATQKVQFDGEVTDTNNNFDTTTNRYTVPVTGFYNISAQVACNQSTAANTNYFISLYKNGSSYAQGTDAIGVAYAVMTVTLSCVPLSAGDYLEVFFTNNNGNTAALFAGSNLGTTFWSGHFVSRT